MHHLPAPSVASSSHRHSLALRAARASLASLPQLSSDSPTRWLLLLRLFLLVFARAALFIGLRLLACLAFICSRCPPCLLLLASIVPTMRVAEDTLLLCQAVLAVLSLLCSCWPCCRLRTSTRLIALPRRHHELERITCCHPSLLFPSLSLALVPAPHPLPLRMILLGMPMQLPLFNRHSLKRSARLRLSGSLERCPGRLLQFPPRHQQPFEGCSPG